MRGKETAVCSLSIPTRMRGSAIVFDGAATGVIAFGDMAARAWGTPGVVWGGGAVVGVEHAAKRATAKRRLRFMLRADARMRTSQVRGSRFEVRMKRENHL